MSNKDDDFLAAYRNADTIQSLAESLGITRKTAVNRLNVVRKRTGKNPDKFSAASIATKPTGKDDDIVSLEKDQQRIASLEKNLIITKRQVRLLKKEVVACEKMKHIISGVKSYKPQEVKWLSVNKKKKSPRRKKYHGVPLLMLSDIHAGELVKPETVGYTNEYNMSVCRDRLQRVIDKAIIYCRDSLAPCDYRGFVLALNGDMISGVIHEELLESADVPVLESILSLSDILYGIIIRLHEEFGSLYIPCTVGNHGRLTPKKSYKGSVVNSYDWLLYQIMAKRLKRIKSIVFDIPFDNDIIYSVEGVNILQTHGDHGIGGGGPQLYNSMVKAFGIRAARQAHYGKPIDHMIVGHFHQHLLGQNFTVNSSVIGTSEYSHLHAFTPDPPAQVMMHCHPKHGIIYQAALLCDDGDAKAKTFPWAESRTPSQRQLSLVKKRR